MSRLRANLSSTVIDQQVQTHVAAAEGSVTRALLLISEARRQKSYPPGRLARVRRDLDRALAALQLVRRVRAPYEDDDVDLQPTAPYEPPQPEEAPPQPEEALPPPEEPPPDEGGEQ